MEKKQKSRYVGEEWVCVWRRKNKKEKEKEKKDRDDSRKWNVWMKKKKGKKLLRKRVKYYVTIFLYNWEILPFEKYNP